MQFMYILGSKNGLHVSYNPIWHSIVFWIFKLNFLFLCFPLSNIKSDLSLGPKVCVMMYRCQSRFEFGDGLHFLISKFLLKVLEIHYWAWRPLGRPWPQVHMYKLRTYFLVPIKSYIQKATPENECSNHLNWHMKIIFKKKKEKS